MLWCQFGKKLQEAVEKWTETKKNNSDVIIKLEAIEKNVYEKIEKIFIK